jgi:hypothetical protein
MICIVSNSAGSNRMSFHSDFNMARDLSHVDVQLIDDSLCAEGVQTMSSGMYTLNRQSSICTYGADNVHNKSACKVSFLPEELWLSSSCS